MHRQLQAALAVMPALGGCATTGKPSAATSPRLGGLPAVFAPGIVSTALPEFSITFAPDGHTLYFDRATADRSMFTILMSRWVNRRWSVPLPAPFSGQYRDVDPFVTPDGGRLYFSSDRPRPGAVGRGLHIWYLERTPSGWSSPINPGDALNSDSTDVFVSVARDGTLLFSSNRDGRFRVYATTSRDPGRQRPVPVRFGSVEAAGNPLISPDGRFVILVMDEPSGKSDLFVSCRASSGWTEPRPLSAAVNSAYAEFAPALDPEGSTLYFTSERPGIAGPQPDSIRPPGDIYRVRLASAGIRCR